MKRWLLILMVGLALISPNYCYAAIASGTSGTCTWTISDSGTLTVKPTSGDEGTLGKWDNLNNAPWREHRESIKKVVFKGKVNALTCAGLFNECRNIESIDLKGLNTSNAVSMECMFHSCISLKQLDVSMLKTGKVTNMNGMFSCVRVETLDLSKFDTSNVTDMSNMFSDNLALKNLNVSKFNTSKVTNMRAMFNNCPHLTKLDVTNFDTRNVTNMS